MRVCRYALQLRSGWNLNGTTQAFIPGLNVVAAADISIFAPVTAMPRSSTRIMKGADHRGVTASQDAGDLPGTPAISCRGALFHEHEVAMHGPVQGYRWNEHVLRGTCPGALWRGVHANKAKPIPVKFKSTAQQPVTTSIPLSDISGTVPGAYLGPGGTAAGRDPGLWPRLRQGKQAVVKFAQIASCSNAGKLLEEQPAFSTATKPKLAYELFITGFAACRACDAGNQLAVGVRVREASHPESGYSVLASPAAAIKRLRR